MYIHALAPKSTLARSPHFSEAKIKGATDYDPNWRQILQQIQRNRDIVSSRQLTLEEVSEEASAAVEKLGRAFLTYRAPIPVPQQATGSTN